MKNRESKFPLILGSVALLGGVMLLLGGCMHPTTVEPNAKVSFSYLALDPQTETVVASGIQEDVVLDFTGSELYQLLAGAKKGEIRMETLRDPRKQHDASLIKKQTALVLQEMGIPVEVGQKVDIGGNPALITNVVMENGIQQVVLDQNPLETILPLHWELTITKIR